MKLTRKKDVQRGYHTPILSYCHCFLFLFTTKVKNLWHINREHDYCHWMHFWPRDHIVINILSYPATILIKHAILGIAAWHHQAWVILLKSWQAKVNPGSNPGFIGFDSCDNITTTINTITKTFLDIWVHRHNHCGL